MSITRKDIHRGDTVTVETMSGALVTGKVKRVHRDVKNGIPGIDYNGPRGIHLWCYLEQVVTVTPKGGVVPVK